MKAVFDARADTGYDDETIHRYYFPNLYLAEARKYVDDRVVYGEPRRGGVCEGYVAVARVTGIVPDPKIPRSSSAHLIDSLPCQEARS